MTVLQIGLRVKELLTKWGFSESFTSGMRDITDFIIAFILIVLTYYVVKFIVLRGCSSYNQTLFNHMGQCIV